MLRKGLIPTAPIQRLKLDSVTLCAASSSNVPATVAALQESMAQIDFGKVLLFTHVSAAELGLPTDHAIRVVPVARITSSVAYSRFILQELVHHITTSHCLVAQWDGHVIDAGRWRSEFLDYDYIGASWPQFDDGHNVGNGGFSLRSKRMMQACLAPHFDFHHPEDIAICRTNRALLNDAGMQFAPAHLADAFSAERSGDPASTFGYHGVFLMPRVLGADRFWDLYKGLDDRGTLWLDFLPILRRLRHPARMAAFMNDWRVERRAARTR